MASLKSVLFFTAIACWASPPPSPVTVKTVPWTPTSPTSPHTVVTGTAATLTATVDLGGSTDPFTYSWNFGDGSPATAPLAVTNKGDSTAVGDVNNLSVTHTYPAATAAAYTAILTVMDTTTSATATGNYYVVVQANTLAARVNQAIDMGLWYLHTSMERGTTNDARSTPVTVGGWDGQVPNSDGAAQGCHETDVDCMDSAGLDATNVQAFEVSGHLENGPTTDPYTDDVARGLAWIMQYMTPYANNGSAGGYGSGQKVVSYNPALAATRCSDGSLPVNYGTPMQACTAPATLINYNSGATSCSSPPCNFTYDGNGNGQILIQSSDGAGDAGYQTGMLVTAIVASQNPAGTARLGVPAASGLPGVLGQTYLNIVQDLIDGIGRCQYYGDDGSADGANNGGGWEYHCAAVENPNYNDNSPSQWNAIAMIAANRAFGITIPPIVQDTNQVWVTWDQCFGSTCTGVVYSTPLTPGSFGYSAWNYPIWGPWAVTPSGMVQLAMDGIGRTATGAADQRWNLTESYYHDNFCNKDGSSTTNPKLYTYGLFSFTKSMEQHDPGGVLMPITFLLDMPAGTNPIDWYNAQAANGDPCDGVAQTLVSRQGADGHWWGVDYTSAQYDFETAWSVQMLQKTSFTACVNDLSGMGVAGPAADLTWTALPSASAYSVQRSSTNGGPYTTVGKANTNSFADSTGLTGGNTYYYVLQPLNVDGRAICTSNQASVAVPSGGGGPTSGGLVVTGADGGTITLGSSVSVSVSASGGTPPYSYSAASVAPPGMTINGATVSGTPTAPGNYSVSIIVTDSSTPPVSGSASVTYSVFGLSTSLPAGIAFSPYQASVGASGGQPPYTYSFSFLPPGLSATNSGTIQGTVRAPGTWNITVTATDSGGHSASAPATFVFTAPGPLTVTPALPSGTVGSVYSAALTANGGAPPYTWTVSSGSLPNGLSLQPGGTISGIPASYGSFSFGVKAMDQIGASAMGAATVNIAPLPLTITTSTPLSTGTMNVEYPSQTISASGGIPPYTFSITSGSLPTNVTLSSNGANATIGGVPTSTGNYSFTVTATDSSAAAGAMDFRPHSPGERNSLNRGQYLPRAATGSANLAMVIRPFANDIVLGAGSLSFTLPAGSMAVPAAQTVSVTATGAAPIPYSAATDGTPWISVSSNSGQTPGTLTIGLTAQALTLAASATPYTASINITCTTAGQCSQPTQSIAVSLTVAAVPPQLSIPTTLLSFSTPASGPAASQQGLTVQNTGGGSIGIANASCEAAWCTVAGVPGAIAGGTSANLGVTADPTGLAAGFYRTQVDLKTSAGVGAVPVTLFISSGSNMTLQPSGSLFQSIAGGVPNGGDDSFLVDVIGSNPVNWSAAVQPGASWLSVTTPSGTSTGTQPGSVSFAIDPVAAAALMPGAYYGVISVSAAGVTNSPLTFEVVLNVAPKNAIQTPSPSPSGLLFISASGTQPPPQTVSVTSNSASPINFSASAGASWLHVSSTGGSASSMNPAQIQVTANPSGLNPGAYYSAVTFNFTGFAEARVVNVTLLVPLPGQDVHDRQSATESASAEPKAVTCSPTQVVTAQVGLVNNFSAPTGWPTPLAMQLLDDCGNYLTSAQVVATFTNGDPALPLTLANPSTGLYSATWTPRKTNSQVTVNAKVVAPGLPALVAQLAGAVTANAAPLLSTNTTLNSYNPVAAAGVAPGTLVQITGSGLAGTAAAAASSPLPTNLNGTQVIVGGIAAPLASVSPGTLQAQLPFELASGMQYQVVVNANGALTAPASIQVVNGDPGVSASMSGLLNATHVDGTAITEASPASPGEYIVLFAAGLGSTDTPVADGAVGPSSPLANALDVPAVTINGETAAVSFAGLQPGKVGVYQVNVQVPADAPNGDLPLVLSQDGNPANSVILPVKKM